jgi:hypothetical protein
VYDALLLPALNYAERDRLEERLGAAEEAAILDATRDLMVDAGQAVRRAERVEAAPETSVAAARPPLAVLGYAVNGTADELALMMLSGVVDDLPVAIHISGGRLLVSEAIALVQEHKYSVVCIADLPPSPPSKTRYLARRLRAAFPDLRIIVGRWGPPALADDSIDAIREAGATRVDRTLLDTRTYLSGLLEIPRTAPLDTSGTHAA